MRSLAQRRSYRLLAGGALLILLLAGSQSVPAEEPGLAINLVGGESHFYPVSEVERLIFEGDTLVVVDIGGEDRYLSSDVARIEFLWGISSVDTPK